VDRLDTSPNKAIAPKSPIVENTTDFTDVLKCLGHQISAYGTKKFYVGNDKIANETGVRDGVPESGRTMLQSAFGTLVKTSASKVVWAGYASSLDSAVITSINTENRNLNKLKSNDTPEYIISGAITQYEKDAQKARRDAGIQILENRIGHSEGANMSVLATSLSLHSTTSENYALYKGIQSSNIIRILTDDVGSGIALGHVKVGGINLDVSLTKKEGVSSALQQLMQLGAVEITGQFYSDDFDYRQCVDPAQRQQILSELAGNVSSYVSKDRMAGAVPLKMSIATNAINPLRNGELVSLSVTSSDNAYLNCFYTMSNGKSVKIFPNKYAHENLVQQGQSVNVPGDERLQIFAEKMPEGQPKDKLFCLLTRVNPASVVNGMIGTVPTDKYSINDLVQALKKTMPPNSLIAKTIELNVR